MKQPVMDQMNLVLSREELSNIAVRIALDERRGVSEEFLALIETISRMAEVLELLKSDRRCFCLMPVHHTVGCKKATEILRLLSAH